MVCAYYKSMVSLYKRCVWAIAVFLSGFRQPSRMDGGNDGNDLCFHAPTLERDIFSNDFVVLMIEFHG